MTNLNASSLLAGATNKSFSEQLELTKFRNPKLVEIEPAIAPPIALGLRSVMFTVESVDDTVGRLRANGAELIGEVAQYEDKYRLCYMRGPRASLSRWPRNSSDAFTAVPARCPFRPGSRTQAKARSWPNFVFLCGNLCAPLRLRCLKSIYRKDESEFQNRPLPTSRQRQ